MLTSELRERQHGGVVKGSSSKQPDPFIFSTDMVRDLHLLAFARGTLDWGGSLRPSLAAGRGEHPDEYSDASVLVTLLVMVVWQLSPRQMAKRLKQWGELAVACGYTPSQTISASQLYRRRDRLGLWVYFLTFCAWSGC